MIRGRFSIAILSAALLLPACEPTAVSETQPVTRSVGTVTAPDGVEIHYETAGTGEPALVFIHGWSCDRSYWSDQIDHFSASHEVVAIDLGGHGESGLDRAEWTMEAYGADVAAVVEALDLHNVVLVGHSMGGPVILEAAQRVPERVAALVPVDYFHDVNPMTEEERQAFVGPIEAAFETATEEFVRSMFGSRADADLVDRVATDMASAPPEVGISSLRHIVTYPDADKIAATAAPIRMINADKWPTNLDAARQQKPDIELAVVPGVGHFVMMEDPAEFNHQLEDAVYDLVMRTGTKEE